MICIPNDVGIFFFKVDLLRHPTTHPPSLAVVGNGSCCRSLLERGRFGNGDPHSPTLANEFFPFHLNVLCSLLSDVKGKHRMCPHSGHVTNTAGSHFAND